MWPLNAIPPFRKGGPIVPVVALEGVIGKGGARGGGLALDKAAPALAKAFAMKKAPAVALSINSPGGSPAQSSLIGGRIRALAAEHDKKVIAFVEDVAASGGYWLACAADEIYADRSSILGSIGVVYAGFGFVEALEKIGVERRLHTAGAAKALLDPFKPESAESIDLLREVQGDIHEAFKDWVLERRGERLGAEPERLFDGRIYGGARALNEGLIDGLGDVRSVMRARFGEKTRFRVLKPARPSLLSRLLDRSDAAASVIEGLNERAHWARYGL